MRTRREHSEGLRLGGSTQKGSGLERVLRRVRTWREQHPETLKAGGEQGATRLERGWARPRKVSKAMLSGWEGRKVRLCL